jgi:RNA polymerase subunit RPABC4/transcription elongation factor Spt4
LETLKARAMPSEEDESTEYIGTAQCGACQEEIPADSESCPKCNVSFSGVKEVNMGECGSCKTIVSLDSKSCPNCSIAFVLDDLLQSVSSWMNSDGLSVKDVFGKWDHNDDGVLSGFEIKEGLIKADIAVLPKTEIERFIHQLDLDNDSKISLTELSTALMLEGHDSSEGDDSEESPTDSEDEPEASSDDADENESDDEEEESTDEEPEVDDDDSGDEEEESTDEESEVDDDSGDEEEESTDEESEVDDDSDDKEEESTDEEPGVDDDDDSDDDGDDDSDNDGDSEDGDDSGEDEDSDEDSDDNEDKEELSLIDQLSNLVRESDDNIKSSFNEFDTNKDKRISANEFRETVEKYFSDSFGEGKINELMDALDEDEDGNIDLIEFVDGIESPETVKDTIKEKKKPDGPSDAQIWIMRNEENIFPIGWSLAGLTLILSVINVYGFFSSIFSCDEGDNAWLVNNEWCANHTKLNLLNIFSPGEAASWSEGGSWGIPDIILVLILVALIGTSIWFRSTVKAWKVEHRKKKTSEDSEEEDEETSTSEDNESDDVSDKDDDSDNGEEDSSDDEDKDDGDSDDEDEDDGDADDEDEDDGDADDAEIEVGSKVGVDHDGEEWNGEIIEFDEDDDEVLVKDNDSGEEYWVPFDALFVD